jgi:hypothetical protein
LIKFEWDVATVRAADPYLTTVPLIARKNRIEKSAPRILSRVKAFLIIDLDRPFIFGISGGSMKSLVPDKKTVMKPTELEMFLEAISQSS